MPVGQRLGIGDVEREAQAGPTAASTRIAAVSATLPRAMLTRSAPSGMAARKAASTSPVVDSFNGTPTMTISAVGSSWRQLVDAVDPPGLVVACAARDARELDLERREPLLDGRAHAAVADEQHAAVRRGSRVEREPIGPRMPHGRKSGMPRWAASTSREGELGGRGLVHARRVREDVAGGRAAAMSS
jgi:hypothetical protein